MVIEQVAVVGAGLAGLTCARELQTQGVGVTVFEKSRGVGGRLSTRRVDWASFDHGTQYFTARDPLFQAWIEDLLAIGTVAQWAPVMRQAPANNDPWYVACPGMNSLGRAQAEGLDVVLNTRVMSFERSDGQWQLVMEDGSKSNRFDAVVVAVPNEQAAPMVEPLQPDWAQRLAATPLQPCWTLMLSTAPMDVAYEAGQPNNGPIGWWARNDSKPGRSTRDGQQDWVVQATPSWTEQHLNDDKASVVSQLQQAFLEEIGVQACTVIETAMAHRWLYARRTSGLPAAEPSWWSDAIRLGVCGDGLTHSRVEQAYLSGYDMARQIQRTV